MSTETHTGTPEPLRLQVYRQLRDDLMNGSVRVGDRMTEPKLAARFGISRTPVREALAMLASDGLIRREDYGFSPQPPSVSRVRNLYELRITLELQGITRAIEDPSVRHDTELLESERLRWRTLAGDPPAQEPSFVVTDEEFHVALLASSGNAELVTALESVNSRIRHVRMYDFMVNSRIETSIAEHLGILDAVIDGDLPTARTLLHRHIGESLSVVLDRVTRAVTAMSLAD